MDSRFEPGAGHVDENHKYGLMRFRRGYVFCNCKSCNPTAKQPKRAPKRESDEPTDENWSRV